MMLDMMFLEPHTAGIRVEGSRQQRTDIPHGFFALPHLNEIKNPGWIRNGVLNLLRQMRVAVLTYGNMIEVADPGSRSLKARFDRQGRETGEVLLAIQPLLCDCEKNLPVVNYRGRRVGVKHIEPQDQHYCDLRLSRVGIIRLRHS